MTSLPAVERVQQIEGHEGRKLGGLDGLRMKRVLILEGLQLPVQSYVCRELESPFGEFNI